MTVKLHNPKSEQGPRHWTASPGEPVRFPVPGVDDHYIAVTVDAHGRLTVHATMPMTIRPRVTNEVVIEEAER